MKVYLFIGVYLLTVNLVGLFCMYLDKRKAKKRLWRIPEAVLFLIAVIALLASPIEISTI